MVLIGALLSALAAVCAMLALHGTLPLERLLGLRSSAPATDAAVASPAAAPRPLPTLVAKSHDAAGSSIDGASYASPALDGQGSFLTYLPPGYAGTTAHYPVLYLLHGNNQPAAAFLQLGLQDELDRLIARHVIPPVIAVMIQGVGAPTTGATRASGAMRPTSSKCRNWSTGCFRPSPTAAHGRSSGIRWAATAR